MNLLDAEAVTDDTYTDADGWVVRESDGEVLGRADEPPAFTVDSDDAADWVLQRMAEAEADALAVDARLKAVTENLAAQRRAVERRLDYLQFRFGASLKEYARTHLKGKERTWRGTWGSVAFRTTAGKNDIRRGQMGEAVAFVEALAPEFVRVEKSVTVTDVKRVMAEFGVDTEPTWLESTGAGERVTIETGVGAQKNFPKRPR